MWEKTLIRLAALYWACGVASLLLAGTMFKEFVQRKKFVGKATPLENRRPLSRNHSGAGRFSAMIGLQGRD
ncbi:MAG: hypothetical protein LAO31_11850 [Acidobacteriia bacterium]|nr:hypothetical protein [Terriglobia bacterium]